MMPEILDLGFATIRGYGLMIGIGIVVCFALSIREARRTGLKGIEDHVVAIFFGIAISAFLGGKIGYILSEPAAWEAAKARDGIGALAGQGFVYYTALICAVPTTIVILRRHRLPVLRCVDVLVPGVPLIHGFGRIGCFLAGCCYGAASDLPWAVTFDKVAPIAHLRVHPTQLYEALGTFAIFLYLWLGPRRRPRFDGHVILVYLLLYAALRFAIEFLRGDGNPVIAGGDPLHLPGEAPSGLTQAQVIALAMAAVALPLLLLGLRRAARADHRP